MDLKKPPEVIDSSAKVHVRASKAEVDYAPTEIEEHPGNAVQQAYLSTSESRFGAALFMLAAFMIEAVLWSMQLPKRVHSDIFLQKSRLPSCLRCFPEVLHDPPPPKRWQICHDRWNFSCGMESKYLSGGSSCLLTYYSPAAFRASHFSVLLWPPTLPQDGANINIG